MRLRDFTIKTQILASFAVFSTIALIVVSGIAFNTVNQTSNGIKSESTSSLEDQVLNNMLLSSEHTADVIKQKFENAEASVRKIVGQTELLFSNGYTLANITSYRDTQLLSIPDVYLDPIYGENISRTTSTYYYPNSVTFNDALNTTVNRSAHLDTLLTSILADNPEFAWLYVSFNDGIFRNFPGALVDLAGQYEPRIEDGWHQDTIAAGKDHLLYSPPYFDLTQGLVVSLTQAVYVGFTPIAVVGLDLKLTTIRDKVANVKFLDTGYASLFQTSDLTIISHPSFDPEKQDPNADLPLVTDLVPDLESQISTITTGESGYTDFLQNGSKYYVAYAPVLDGEGNPLYTMLVIVLASEITQVVKDIQANIEGDANTATGLTVTISIIAIIGTLAVGLILANSITKPISKLTDLTMRITQNVTKRDLFEGVDTSELERDDDDEIDDLTNSFADMISKLKTEHDEKLAKK